MYICKYCNKEFDSIFQKSGHECFCPLNPNREERLKKTIEASKKAVKEKSAKDPLNEIKTYNLICSRCGKPYQLDIKIRDFNHRSL